MVDPLSQQIIQEIGNNSVGETASTPSVVSAEDASSFQNMVTEPVDINSIQPVSMGQESTVQGLDAQNAATIPDSSSVTPVKGEVSLGDRILQGLESIQNDAKVARDSVTTQIQGDSRVNQMLDLQLQVSQLTANQQILGQVGSKTNQGMQTLLKGQ